MDELKVAPVPLRRVQSARSTPGLASFRTQVFAARSVHASVDYDLVAVLFPPPLVADDPPVIPVNP
jgi:hypothetical protein